MYHIDKSLTTSAMHGWSVWNGILYIFIQHQFKLFLYWEVCVVLWMQWRIISVLSVKFFGVLWSTYHKRVYMLPKHIRKCLFKYILALTPVLATGPYSGFDKLCLRISDMIKFRNFTDCHTWLLFDINKFVLQKHKFSFPKTIKTWHETVLRK